jgi:hypothetical protein
MKHRLLLAAGLAFVASLPARADNVVKCVAADGVVTYTNVGSTKGCQKVEVMHSSPIPAPRLPARTGSGSTGGSGGEVRADTRATQASFPRVDADTQKARDNDRRRILEEELRTEQEKLARLRGEFNNGEPERRGDESRNYARYQERIQRMQEDIQRSENNVVSLQREIALLRP